MINYYFFLSLPQNILRTLFDLVPAFLRIIPYDPYNRLRNFVHRRTAFAHGGALSCQFVQPSKSADNRMP